MGADACLSVQQPALRLGRARAHRSVGACAGLLLVSLRRAALELLRRDAAALSSDGPQQGAMVASLIRLLVSTRTQSRRARAAA